jgi:hypothetical protein
LEIILFTSCLAQELEKQQPKKTQKSERQAEKQSEKPEKQEDKPEENNKENTEILESQFISPAAPGHRGISKYIPPKKR